MNTRSARIRAGIVTGLAAASLTLAGCTDSGSGDDGGEEQQEQEQEQEGGDD